MKNESGGAAFPNHGAFPGMSLRDYFAAKAMQELIGVYNSAAFLDDAPKEIAELAYRYADAMVQVSKRNVWSEWKSWYGGPRPVADGIDIQAKTLGGGTLSTNCASDLSWERSGKIHDIVAYRVLNP